MRSIILLPFLLVTIGLLAFVTNIVKLTDCDFEAPYRCEAIHGIGLLPPVALVTVWFTTDKAEQ